MKTFKESLIAGNLNKSNTALRYSKNTLNQIVKLMVEYKRGKIDAEEFAKIMLELNKDCVDALKLIDKV